MFSFQKNKRGPGVLVAAGPPHRNTLLLCLHKLLTKPGPADMPTIAMKLLRPTEFMNQTVGDGILPKDGRVERSHPSTSPAMSAPPAVESVSGTPPTFRTSAPTSAPTAIPAPMNATSATSVGRSATPNDLAAAPVSDVRPTRVTMSPRWSCVFGKIGIVVAVAPRVIFRR